MALCPQCGEALEMTAAGCPDCHAIFTAEGGWRPLPHTPPEVAAWKELHPTEDVPVYRRRRQSAWGVFFLVVVVLGVGAMYGVLAHRAFAALYSHPGDGRSGLMLTSFLVGVPIAIAALWTLLLARGRHVGFWKALSTSTIPGVLFVFIAGAFLREGYLCVLMALPLFIFFGLVGGAIGWAASKIPSDRGPKLLGVGMFLPLLLGGLEDASPPPDAIREVRASVHIAAPPATVWRHINFPLDIRREELQGGWAYRMGVPYPLEARTLEPRVGGLRALRWERGVNFQEEITRYDEERAIAWRYRFTPASFPAGSLDEHVVIGGRYFDLLDTGYELAPEAGGTRLSIRVGYRVSTGFNWYAEPWARFLIGDTAEAILRFYRQRSERTAA